MKLSWILSCLCRRHFPPMITGPCWRQPIKPGFDKIRPSACKSCMDEDPVQRFVRDLLLLCHCLLRLCPDFEQAMPVAGPGGQVKLLVKPHLFFKDGIDLDLKSDLNHWPGQRALLFKGILPHGELQLIGRRPTLVTDGTFPPAVGHMLHPTRSRYASAPPLSEQLLDSRHIFTRK